MSQREKWIDGVSYALFSVFGLIFRAAFYAIVIKDFIHQNVADPRREVAVCLICLFGYGLTSFQLRAVQLRAGKEGQ